MRQELRHEPAPDAVETDVVVDAAESRWDPVLYALYLRELAEQHRKTGHAPD